MKALTLDTETHLIEPDNKAPKMVSLATKLEGHETQLIHAKDPNTPDTIDALFKVEGVILNGHNIPYDFGVLVNHRPQIMEAIFDKYRKDEVWDTGIADKLAHIGAGWMKGRPDGEFPKFNLAAVARRTLGITVEGKEGADAWRLRYSELDDIPVKDWPNAASHYAITDVDVTHDIFKHQYPKKSYLATIDIQLRSNWALHLMSCWGLTVDQEAVDTLKISLDNEIGESMDMFKEMGIYRSNGVRNMAVIKDLVEESYEVLGKTVPRTKTGPSTAMRTLVESGDPILIKLAKLSSVQKLKNTFIPVLELGTGGRSIHPNYDTLKETGRCSSYGPNIQQLPRKGGVRECFIPRKGMVFVAADYDCAELCSLAQVLLKLFGTSKMADALNAGKDLHIQTASAIMGISYDDCLRRYREGDKETAEVRQTSKVANFGYPGGLGAKGFVGYAAGYDLTITWSEASSLRRLWMSEYPEMDLYFKWINEQMGMGGSFTSIHNVTGFVRGNVGYCDGANHQFQHLTAAGAKIALFDIAEECYVNKGTALFGCRPVAFIHDEVLMEAPEANAHEAALRLSELMENGMAQVLDDVKCTVEATMMRRWHKKAKPTYEGGRLIPWEPSK